MSLLINWWIGWGLRGEEMKTEKKWEVAKKMDDSWMPSEGEGVFIVCVFPFMHNAYLHICDPKCTLTYAQETSLRFLIITLITALSILQLVLHESSDWSQHHEVLRWVIGSFDPFEAQLGQSQTDQTSLNHTCKVHFEILTVNYFS